MSGHDTVDLPRSAARIDDDALFAALERRVVLAPEIAPGSDLRTWSAERLREARLPPRPSDANPLARTGWEEALAHVTLVPPRALREFFAISRHSRQSVAAKTTSGSSQNWSGAVVAIPDDWSCHSLQAEWRVPHAKPGVPAHPPAGDHWQGSAWIGLDGDLPGSVTMPQLGSAHHADRSNGVVTSTASLWWQWWIANDPNGAPLEIPIAVAPHDRVFAMITVRDPLSVNFFIKNVTTDLAASFDVLAASLPGLPPVPIEQQTMDWIVERQREIGGTALLPFADYGSCRFEHCAASMRDPAGNALAMDLADPPTLQIQDWVDPPQTGAIISAYAGGDADTIRVHYRP